MSVARPTQNHLLALLFVFGERHDIEIGVRRANRIVRDFLDYQKRYRGDATPRELFSSFLQRRLRLTAAARHRIEADPDFARVVQYLDRTGEWAVSRVNHANPQRGHTHPTIKYEGADTMTAAMITDAPQRFEPLLGVPDIAAALACHPHTVRKLIRDGDLRAFIVRRSKVGIDIREGD
jgi:hypothetical protein